MIKTKCAICGKEIKLKAGWDSFTEDEEKGRIVCPNHSNEELIKHNKVSF